MSVKISPEDVRRMAGLCRLQLTEEEVGTFGPQLNTILEHVRQLERPNTEGIEPTSHVLPLSNIMRDDIVGASLPGAEALGNAPDRTDKFYRVPKILE
jgi:aspartyl-tRNA(Asn)/glutamyl-tRNA(Gln) amidotransferase subunit C